ncbi:MAG: flotillin-like FloA family protein [Planctomycetota bacterium]|jgi:uncharacterized protein YqfA (UPF0365 family)
MTAFWFVTGTLIVAALLYVVSQYFSLWLQAYVSGTRISLFALIMMTLRNVDPRLVVRCKVMMVQAGVPEIPINAIEAQFLAGGDIQRVTLALIAANRARINLNWNTATAIDLAGRDILDAVKVSVNPRVINCPEPGTRRGDTLDGVARDGIQLMVRVRVTVRTNVSQLVGGATEATVIARIGEGIVSAIGSCETYLEALADPQVITRRVLAQGLDSQTAFSIVSIDIADISVGTNIGAKLRIDQANTDIRIARAAAETRRAAAVAHRQEMVALTVRHRAELIDAEALIPDAIADVFRNQGLSTSSSRWAPRHRAINQSLRSAAQPPR